LTFFKSNLTNAGLDIGLLLRQSALSEQYDAVKSIIDSGFDMNKQHKIMAFELFMCANTVYSEAVIEIYLQFGLRINQSLIKEIMKIARYHSDEFDPVKTMLLIEDLKKYKKLN